MSYISDETIRTNLHELHIFIEENAAIIKAVSAQAPRTYSQTSLHKGYDDAWRVGFGRCLAELKRLANKL